MRSVCLELGEVGSGILFFCVGSLVKINFIVTDRVY